MKNINLIAFALLLSSYACNSDKVISDNSDKSTSYTPSKSLAVNDELVLTLDALTAPVSTQLQYIEEENYLAYWNRNDYSIEFFDMDTGEVSSKIFYNSSDRGSPNYNKSSNFFYHNPDSLFSVNPVGHFYLFNSKAQVLQRYPTGDANKINFVPDPYVWNGSPIILHNEKLFFQVYVGGLFDQEIMATLDLNSKEINYYGEFPEFYQNAYWRGGYDFWYYTFNREKGLIVQSFEADHNIRVNAIDQLDYKSRLFYASSSDYGELKPAALKMGEASWEEHEKNYFSQPSFGLIHYDKYNGLYYRFAFDGISDTDLNDSDPERATVKPTRIIILDEDFNKVGEVKLPRFKYDTRMSFVGKKGLHIKVKDKENEDILTFDVFQPEDLNP